MSDIQNQETDIDQIDKSSPPPNISDKEEFPVLSIRGTQSASSQLLNSSQLFKNEQKVTGSETQIIQNYKNSDEVQKQEPQEDGNDDEKEETKTNKFESSLKSQLMKSQQLAKQAADFNQLMKSNRINPDSIRGPIPVNDKKLV